MIGYIQLVLDGAAGDLSEDQRNFLEIAEKNANRQLRLVSDLLLVSKVEMGKFDIRPAPVRLAELVSQAVKPVIPIAEEMMIEVDLSVRCDSVYLADADRLTQLVDNLLSNALKFTSGGGTDKRGASRVRGRSRARGPQQRLPHSARRTGRVFDRLFRCASAGENGIAGVGLGLTICMAIVEPALAEAGVDELVDGRAA